MKHVCPCCKEFEVEHKDDLCTTCEIRENEEYFKYCELHEKRVHRVFDSKYKRLWKLIYELDYCGGIEIRGVTLSSVIKDIVIEKTICKLKGHDVTDYGYGGPETGHVDLGCKRCQRWGHYETLY